MTKQILRNWLPPLLIFALNLYLVFPLFQGEFTQFMGSIEAQLLAQAKFISENFPHISWYPFWYNGFPFPLVYPPLVSFTLSIFHSISGLSLGQGYRILTALFYSLGGVSVYFLVRYLTSHSLSAFISALFYSFLPSAVFLIPGISELGQHWGLPTWRLMVLSLFGEGAHIWALSSVPLAILFYLKLLRRPDVLNFSLSLILIILVLLTSFTAFMGLLIFLAISFFMEAIFSFASKKIYLSSILAIFVLTLSSFWYNFSFWRTIAGFARPGGGGSILSGIYSNLGLIVSISLPVLALFVVVFVTVLKKKPELKNWFIGLGSFLLLFFTLYIRYRFSFALLPLPFDYLPRIGPEVELSFALVLGLLTAAFLGFLQKKLKAGIVFGLFLILVLLWIATKQAPTFQRILQPHFAVEQTTEYRITQFLEKEAGQERVYATGTHAFWLNVFSDVWQLRGDADQVPNPIWMHLSYQIYHGQDGPLAIDWLRALGYKYIVVNSSASKVDYKDYLAPEKFEGQATKIYEYQGDLVYLLPTQNTGLAGFVSEKEISQLPSLVNAKEGKTILDKKWLNEYLNLTEYNPEFEKVNYQFEKSWNKLTIKPIGFKEGQVILVRQNNYSGWRAWQDSQKLEIKSDPLGFILIVPQSDSEISLSYHPTYALYLGYLISIFSIFALVFYLRSKGFREFILNYEKPDVKIRTYESQ